MTYDPLDTSAARAARAARGIAGTTPERWRAEAIARLSLAAQAERSGNVIAAHHHREGAACYFRKAAREAAKGACHVRRF